MKYILFLFFLIIVSSKKFSFKFINTPIYNSFPSCLFHSIVLLENTNFDNVNNEKKYDFVLDFTPIEDIASPNVIFKLLQGKNIQGMVRVSRFSKEFHKSIFTKEHFKNIFYSNKNTFFEDDTTQVTNENLKQLEIIDPYLVSIIKSWGSSFQIYKRNCRHFSNFLYKNYF